MRAMVFDGAGRPLSERDVPEPVPGPHQILIDVLACGVCRTDLHIVDGELDRPKPSLIPGHQVVGRVAALGAQASGPAVGDRVGVPWLAGTCGVCRYCASDRDNLCDAARFTGYDVDGGFAERCVADARYCLRMPDGYADAEVAPLLCAGLIGFRALRMAGDARRIGFYGFGASAHLLAQIARHEGREVYAFTRPGDAAAQSFARGLGAVWSGDADAAPPEELDAAIVFAPVGALVPAALRAVARGGTVVCAGIHMSDIPSFPYALLWGERTLRSVANLTRRDGEAFFALAPRVPVRAQVHRYPLERANEALGDLREGRLTGAAVIATDAAG